MGQVVPAADQLLKQFFRLAQDVIEAANPQENFLSALQENAFLRGLKGLNLLSYHNCVHLAQMLGGWMKATSQDITQKYKTPEHVLLVQGVCKRAALWILSFEAGMQLMETIGPEHLSHRDVASLCDKILNEAVDCVVRAEELIPRYAQYEMGSVRQQVVERAAKVIGAMSRVSIDRVLHIFITTLKSKLPQKKDLARDQAIALCSGMRHTVLSLSSEIGLLASTHFLERCNPLHHVGAKNKSQVQHAICNMLTAVLSPLVREAAPAVRSHLNGPSRVQWYRCVTELREGLTKWVNKNAKHIPDGYPLITVLVCLSDNESYATLVDTTADMLLRQMKLKDWRLVCLRCLNQLIASYLHRYFKHMPLAEVHKWLDKCTKPVLVNFKKGNLMGDHQEMIFSICSTVAEVYPRYALEEMVIEMLAPEPWECCTIGLRAVLGIAMAAPPWTHTAASRGAPSSNLSVTARVSVSKQAQHQQVLEQMRKGHHPLDLPELSPVLPKLLASLSRLLALCHQQLGNFQLFGSEGLPREKQPFVHILTGLLNLMPYVKPDLWHWPSGQPLRELAGYTAHVEGQVRMLACSAMQMMVRGVPPLRNTLLVQLTSFITTIPDDSLRVLHEGLSLLRHLATSWLSVLTEAASSSEVGEPFSRDAVSLDLGWLEGVLLAFLCHYDDTTRRDALGLLGTVRELHRALQRLQATAGEGSGPPAPEAYPPLGPRQRSASRDSTDMKLTGGLYPDGCVYLMDVIEETGPSLVAHCYWDFWDWSDLWRDWKGVPEEATFEAVVLAVDEMARLRRARLLGALMSTAALLCPGAVSVAYAEANSRLSKLMLRDYNGRLIPPNESSEARKLEAWCSYAALACGTPALCSDRVDLSGRYKSLMGHKELVSKVLLAVLSHGGSYVQQQGVVLALGHLHPQHLERLMEELPQVVDRFQGHVKQKGKVKPEEVSQVRTCVANIYRIAAYNLPPTALDTHHSLRSRFLNWMLDAYRTFMAASESLKSVTPVPPFSEAFWDLLQVAYCLCSVSRCLAPQLVRELSLTIAQLTGNRRVSGQGSPMAPPTFNTPFRKALFELFASWCELGMSSPDYHSTLSAGISAAVSRAREESSEEVRQDLTLKADYLDQAARQAMAAMLQGPAFDTDARRSQGPVLGWMDRLLSSSRPPPPPSPSRLGPSRPWVARMALRHLLTHNLDLMPTAVNRCYHEDQGVAKAYFQVLVEVYTQQSVDCEQHILLSLILYKLVDPNQQVREDALHMLKVLEGREWRHGPRGPPSPLDIGEGRDDWMEGGGDAPKGICTVLGSLQDSYQQFLYHLSAKLAREHPEVSESLCEEMMTRQLDSSDMVTQHPVLSCLVPWMDNLVISTEWQDTQFERLLKSMYLLTLRHGHQYPFEIERLWSALAANKRNITPILQYLISFGMHSALQDLTTMLDYFGVAKRISLYLARVSPQQTIDQLVLEMLKQVAEEDPPQSPKGASPTSAAASRFSLLLPGTETSESVASMLSTAGSSSLIPAGSIGLRVGSYSGDSLAAMSSGRGLRQVESAREGGRTMGLLVTKSDSASSRSSSHMAALQATFGEASSGLHLSMRSKAADAPPPLPSQRSLTEPPSPMLRPLLSRPELALCLLAEVAYEQDSSLRDHLPLLLHAAVTLADHEEGQVAAHCQQLLLNLLYSLSASNAEPEDGGEVKTDCSKATALIRQLQSHRGRQLWAQEETSLSRPHLPSSRQLQQLTRRLLVALDFEEQQLLGTWGAQALRWALFAHSRRLSYRSFQVYRALAPPLTVESSCSLLCCLQHTLASPAPAALDTALEPMLTLQVLAANADTPLLTLYPHLFWAAIALLFTDTVPLFKHALTLFNTLLTRLPLSTPTTPHVLLVAAPPSASATAIANLTSTALLISSPAPTPLLPTPDPTNPFLSSNLSPTTSLPPSYPLNTSPSPHNPFLSPSLSPSTSITSRTSLEALTHLEPWHIGQNLIPSPHETHHSPPRLLAIQHLLLKGLASPDSFVPTLHCLSNLARHLSRLQPLDSLVAHPLLHLRSREMALQQQIYEAILGGRQQQLFITLAGSLPYMCTHLVCGKKQQQQQQQQQGVDDNNEDSIQEAIELLVSALCAACSSQGLPQLALRLGRLSEVCDWGSLNTFLANLAVQLCSAFFPHYARWLLLRFIEFLRCPAPEPFHQVVLLLVRSVFTVPTLQLGPTAISLLTSSSLLHPIVLMAQGSLSKVALEALDAVLAFCDSSQEVAAARGGVSSSLPLPPAFIDISELEATIRGNADIAAALEQVLETTGAASRLSKLNLLPHVPRPPTNDDYMAG